MFRCLLLHLLAQRGIFAAGRGQSRCQFGNLPAILNRLSLPHSDPLAALRQFGFHLLPIRLKALDLRLRVRRVRGQSLAILQRFPQVRLKPGDFFLRFVQISLQLPIFHRGVEQILPHFIRIGLRVVRTRLLRTRAMDPPEQPRSRRRLGKPGVFHSGMFPKPPHARNRHSDRVIADRTIRREPRAGFLDGEGLPALRTLELNICVFCNHLVPSHVIILAKVMVEGQKIMRR
jgi:hypothetical protein